MSADDRSGALSQARAIIQRAEKDANDLNTQIVAWLGQYTSSKLRKRQLPGSKYVVEAMFRWEEIPGSYREDAYRVARVLMEALDSIAEALCLGGRFPTARSHAEFKATFVGSVVSKLPRTLRASIEELEPYKGGYGEAVFRLREIVSHNEDQILEFYAARDPSLLRRIAQKNRIRFAEEARLDASKKSLVLFEAPEGRKFDEDVKIPLKIVFGGIDLVDGKSTSELLFEACDIMRQFIEHVEGV